MERFPGALCRVTHGRLFVPLGGKSHDMHGPRAQGFTVAGAELSRLNVQK